MQKTALGYITIRIQFLYRKGSSYLDDVLIYVKPTEVLTVDAETGEILRRSSGRIRDLNVSRVVLECWDYEEKAKIVYEKEEPACSVS